MALQKRKGRDMILLKRLILFITCLSFFGLLSCSNSGTNSTASSGGTSGTGTNWNMTVQVGTNPIRLGDTTTVLAIVKDNTGAPAPFGTNICFTAVRNGFLVPGTKVDPTNVIKTVCETTKNNLGQSIQTYVAILTTGDDTIEVSSQNIIKSTIITVNN